MSSAFVFVPAKDQVDTFEKYPFPVTTKAEGIPEIIHKDIQLLMSEYIHDGYAITSIGYTIAEGSKSTTPNSFIARKRSQDDTGS
jgi:hypothetical protein